VRFVAPPPEVSIHEEVIKWPGAKISTTIDIVSKRKGDQLDIHDIHTFSPVRPARHSVIDSSCTNSNDCGLGSRRASFGIFLVIAIPLENYHNSQKSIAVHTPSFPAATAIVKPCLTAAATAMFKALLFPPPRLMFATHLCTPFFCASARAHWIPAMTVVFVPLPSSPRTLTPIRWVFLATPYFVPPIVPATWVPCPWRSVLVDLRTAL